MTSTAWFWIVGVYAFLGGVSGIYLANRSYRENGHNQEEFFWFVGGVFTGPFTILLWFGIKIYRMMNR